jgi:hypothetical protein
MDMVLVIPTMCVCTLPAARTRMSSIGSMAVSGANRWNDVAVVLTLCVAGSILGGDAVHASPSVAGLPSQVVTQARRALNLAGLFGSATNPNGKEGPYDRIMGHPVFQVTTSWGSAYMNMEKLTDLVDGNSNDGIVDDLDEQDLMSGKTILGSDSNQYRTISLYYMDPDDAVAAHAEFKQMEQMDKADLRITAVSLSKALKSASNLGNGLLTGQPIDPLTGRVPSTRDGGSLRHKIMPPKKQLYYAARCHGKERVGFFGTGGDEQAALRDLAQTAVLGNSALTYRNLQRRQAKRDRKVQSKPKSALEGQYAHMDGQLGIPVFYAQGMERRLPLWKGLISGGRRETPLFFNYEDLLAAWQKTRVGPSSTRGGTKYLPMEPSVEVFNLMDVLTSMERDQDRRRKQRAALPITQRVAEALAQPLQRRLAPMKEPAGLDSITFVPSSDAAAYKESITARGNGKARLRPMR